MDEALGPVGPCLMKSLSTHTSYVFARGTVTAVGNMDEILEPHVRFFTGSDGPDFILMVENAWELIWSPNFWKVRIFSEWIGQLYLQTSSI
ncbi:hypothetical protein TNCV_1845031 [Trichonephila clavipes]|nr:hypothetical protein TNCV_1845031 [Trichonephila clavipes]